MDQVVDELVERSFTVWVNTHLDLSFSVGYKSLIKGSVKGKSNDSFLELGKR